jgi:hypothetical protein
MRAETLAPGSPLRVGVMLDSFVQPQWVYDILAGIQQSGFATLALVIENGDVDRPVQGFFNRLLHNRGRIAYTLYTRFDDFWFRRQPDAFTNVSTTELLASVPVQRVTPIKKKFSDYFEPSDVEAIRARGLDVVLRFGFRILRGESLNVARYGVWSYHHGDNLVNRGGPPGFWEVMRGEPVTGSILQVLSDELDNGRVIYRSHAPTDRRSVRRNLENFYRKTAEFVIRKLRDVADRGAAALDCDTCAADFMPYCRPLYREPGNLETLALVARLYARWGMEKVRELLYHDQWSLACRVHPNQDGPDAGLHRFKLLTPPRDRFWADPFPLQANGRHYVFIEELPYHSNKGHISVLEIDKRGAVVSAEKVLEQEEHLSYPFVFEWQGAHYMIPETGARRRVELYRADDFPRGWRLERVLVDGVRAADATVHEIDGTWWMFANVGVEKTRNYDELHIYYAASPLGPWTPHRLNPVKSDARSARPAGRLFTWNGRLYRPSQDCSGQYGAAVVINRVDRLTPTEFQETAVSRLEPKWAPNLLATHTLNSAPGLTVVDVLVRRWRLSRTPSSLPAVAVQPAPMNLRPAAVEQESSPIG